MKNQDKNPIYTWEYNEEPPIAELLEQARKYPKHKVWELQHGGTFVAITFAAKISTAQKRFDECFEIAEAQEAFKPNVKAQPCGPKKTVC